MLFSWSPARPTCHYSEWRNKPAFLRFLYCSAQHSLKDEKKHTRFKNTIHLWEFLLELLEDEQFIQLISWTRKEHGEFKLKNQEEVAKRWGWLKQRAGMNYDKLSRALRYYYQKGIIKKVRTYFNSPSLASTHTTTAMVAITVLLPTTVTVTTTTTANTTTTTTANTTVTTASTTCATVMFHNWGD